MNGYKIKIDGLPKKIFACSTTVDSYNWENRNKKTELEFSYVISDQQTIITDSMNRTLDRGEYFISTVGNENKVSFCPPGVCVEITTVAVSFDALSFTATELSKEDTYDNNCYLLPSLWENDQIPDGIPRLLNQYIVTSVSDTSWDKALSTALWFETLSLIDKTTRELLTAQKSSHTDYYVKKLDYIIEKNYADKVVLGDIAKEFGISESYLSHIYSVSSKKTFRQSLMAVRMDKAKELVCTTNLSAVDIAGQVGICDESSLRKCFKKHFGVSMSEFRKIIKGMTMYHDKPIPKSS